MTKVTEFFYTGTEQTFQLTPGVYILETWGASAPEGTSTTASWGHAGYSRIKITVATWDAGNPLYKLYIRVGGQGTQGNDAKGGWNGGGNAGPSTNTPSSGGGMTSISTYPKDGIHQNRWLDSTTNGVSTLILCAGGNGGRSGGTTYRNSGRGGGISGENAASDGGRAGGGGGTQTAGGAGGPAGSGISSPGPGQAGSLGQGGNGGKQNGTTSISGSPGGGGGGGFYGGGGGGGANVSDAQLGGGGGSGFISAGSIVWYDSTLYNPSGFVNAFASEGITAAYGQPGYVQNPNFASNKNGYARITLENIRKFSFNLSIGGNDVSAVYFKGERVKEITYNGETIFTS